MGYFVFKGKKSSDFGLMVAAAPDQGGAQRQVDRIPVAGRNGALLIDRGRYEDIVCVYAVGIKVKRGEIAEYAGKIKEWLLSDVGVYRLADTYNPAYFRKASYAGPLDIENVLNLGSRFAVSFTCDPFKFSFDGQRSSVLTVSGKSVTNVEMFESRPYFKVYGSGNGNLYLSGPGSNSTIQLKNISEYVEIDSELFQVFKGSTNKSNDVIMPEKWPTFATGKTVISWDGGITKVEYIPRWCTL